MLLFVLAYLGGALTILSPCVLPVIPFIFARADKPFLKSGLPLFVGMALTFAVVATLATVGGGWAVRANEIGRWVAVVLLALFAATLLSTRLADLLSRPFVQLGGRLTEANASESNMGQSLLLGVATGLLWAPCAGPILGLILTTAALQGASAKTAVLLLLYALGSVTSLAIVLLAGKRAMAVFRKSQRAEEWIRRIVGVAVLLGVIVIAFGLERGLLTKLSGPGTSKLESSLIAKLSPSAAPRPLPDGATGLLKNYGMAPDFTGAATWINSPPLTLAGLKGKVVVVDFWTYSCINCLRTLPYVKAWAQQYASQGLVVIGVHTPEFAFEHQKENVRKAIQDLGVAYPVAMDNDWTIWKAFKNQYWPAHYFIDTEGRIRYEHFGEGGNADSEKAIRVLLAERNGQAPAASQAKIDLAPVAIASKNLLAISPETYVGYAKAQRFASAGGLTHDMAKTYAFPVTLAPDAWALSGSWKSAVESSSPVKAGAGLRMRFHARDLNMVLGPKTPGMTAHFRVLIDGKPPGTDHGLDADAAGKGVITDQRLYQLVRQTTGMKERLFEIEFLDADAQLYSFTFG